MTEDRDNRDNRDLMIRQQLRWKENVGEKKISSPSKLFRLCNKSPGYFKVG